MISRMVERTNEQMRKVHEKINPNKFQFRYSDTSEEKINVYLDCCILEAYTTIQNNQRENFGMTIFLQGTFTGVQCL